jgi:hypothetical protein
LRTALYRASGFVLWCEADIQGPQRLNVLPTLIARADKVIK